MRPALVGIGIGLLTWVPMFFIIRDTEPERQAAITIKLNTLTPIVMSGHLTIMGADGDIRVLAVEAGDTFILRSIP